ncbi:MAG: TonB-dependent receptor plug domain-containing protein, partial [Chitinophagales bacterium]
MRNSLLSAIFLLCSIQLSAQHSVSGTVTDEANEPLIGVNVVEEGTTNGTITDLSGKYTLKLDANATLVFSYIGYSTIEMEVNGQTTLDAQLAEGINLGAIQVVGTRSYKRSATDSPVAVDVINIQEVASQNGNVELNRILQYLAPSFNATKQSGADGAEHIDPASLRGLGPDQTLVLINGKRRHQSSLINIFGTRGLGNTGTDFNAIPASAIERIEILRDGAAAQYGSDAIAGVINIVLRRSTGKLTGSVTTGGYNTNAPGDFDPEASNIEGNYTDPEGDGVATTDDYPGLDGKTVKVAANYGFDLGTEGGYANFTTEFVNKEKTLRPGAPWRKGMGEAEISGFAAFFNAAVPVSENTE